MRKCVDCSHWNQTENKGFFCGLFSLTCSASKTHPYFIEKDAIKPVSDIQLRQGGKEKVKTKEVMSDEEFVKAQRSRQNQPDYPDIRTLTEESKKQLRRRK